MQINKPSRNQISCTLVLIKFNSNLTLEPETVNSINLFIIL